MFTTGEDCRPDLHQVIRMFLLSCLLMPCLVLAGLAQATYTITDLGTLPGGATSTGVGINASGQVTGWSDTNTNDPNHLFAHAFIYTPGANPSMLDLGTLGGSYSFAEGINASGQVTGRSLLASGEERAFLYSSGTMTDLGTLGGSSSQGYGINDSGWITGSADIDATTYHAFLYNPNTFMMSDLGTLGTGPYSQGRGINALGWVTGYSGPVATTHTFLYSYGAMSDLGVLPTGTFSQGFGINSSGQITGWGDANTVDRHAFLYSASTGLVDLDPTGAALSEGVAINACGQIVGQRGGLAVLYSANTGFVDLNTLLPGNSGWTLGGATSINDRGQITGFGSIGGAEHAFLLTPVSQSAFVCTGSMRTPRFEQAAALLSGGDKVLITGGSDGATGSLATSEVYDSTLGSFKLTEGIMSYPRYAHTATLLDNGYVLIAGGYNSFNNTYLTSADLFNPADTTIAATGDMSVGRQSHTATLLDSGKVLITGGLNGTSFFSSAELYDPAGGTFTPTSGSMHAPRYGHTATLLGSGKVLITGGCGSGGSQDCVATAELYDPTNDTFTLTGSMLQARAWHTATLLSNGKVLIAGGNQGATVPNAELYDPVTGNFSATGPMLTTFGAVFHTATILLDGRVLIAGGDWGAGATNQAQLYDPIAGSFSLVTGTMSSPRFRHTSTRLGNGQVLVTGGANGGDPNVVLASADLYQAPESITQPLSSGGGTASFIFNNNVYNIVYQYPPGYVPNNNYSLTVTPIQTSQADWALRTPPGNAYAGTQLAPVTGLGGDGIIYRAVCADTATGTIPCPAPPSDLFYITNTSWSGPVGDNPGFLKAPIGSNNWENVFVSFSPTRTDGGPDPTGVGKSNGGFSDWAFVYKVSPSSPASITITSPANNATYVLNAAVNADYGCTGSVACIGDAANGAPIDTASVGTKTFHVFATVNSGKPVSASVQYTVALSLYSPCLLYDSGKSVKSGADYPIKFYLCDGSGNNLSNPSLIVNAASLTKVSTGASADVMDAGNSNPDNNFRFSSDLYPGGGYIFNFSTKGLKGTYKLSFTVTGDAPGATHFVFFQVR
jgi:probable HAF family extracellular repeat protein